MRGRRGSRGMTQLVPLSCSSLSRFVGRSLASSGDSSATRAPAKGGATVVEEVGKEVGSDEVGVGNIKVGYGIEGNEGSGP